MLRQIGVEGIVTALHDIPNGEVWSLEAVLAVQKNIEDAGLRWSVVESLPVAEAIKYAGPDRESLIDNYVSSLESLGKAGVKTVCYNFMPVIDWIRTDLNYHLPDGTSTLFFDKIKFAYFDLSLLKRKDAEKDYSEEVLKEVYRLDKSITQKEKDQLIDTIIVKTQGFVNGNIKEGDQDPVALFNRFLSLYEGITKDALRENLRYFLVRIMPVCEKYRISMCIHPDDPPYPVLGLPRIVTGAEDIRWILQTVNKPYNGLTFCAGSLSSGLHNDVVKIAAEFAGRTRFVHLRSTDILEGCNFIEAPHLEGRGNLVELVRIFEQKNPSLPMRIDHGKQMLGDEDKGYNPGYSFHGRMFALAQMDGVMAAVRHLEPVKIPFRDGTYK